MTGQHRDILAPWMYRLRCWAFGHDIEQTGHALWAEIGRPPMAYPTPAQLVEFLRRAPDHLAQRTAGRYIEAMQDAARCFEYHDRRRA